MGITSIPGRLKVYLGFYPRSIRSLLEISISGKKFNKDSLEFHNHRFVDNYESSLLDLVFKITLTASTSIFQSFTYLHRVKKQFLLFYRLFGNFIQGKSISANIEIVIFKIFWGSMLLDPSITCLKKISYLHTYIYFPVLHIGLFIGLSFCLGFNFGIYICNLKLAAITLTLVFSRSPKPSVQNFWSSRLHSFSQPLENEPITRMSQRRLPMKTRQTNSEAKHQTTYSIRSRICKSTPGRISFELFRLCCPTPAYMVPEDLSLNRVKSQIHLIVISRDC